MQKERVVRGGEEEGIGELWGEWEDVQTLRWQEWDRATRAQLRGEEVVDNIYGNEAFKTLYRKG